MIGQGDAVKPGQSGHVHQITGSHVPIPAGRQAGMYMQIISDSHPALPSSRLSSPLIGPLSRRRKSLQHPIRPNGTGRPAFPAETGGRRRRPHQETGFLHHRRRGTIQIQIEAIIEFPPPAICGDRTRWSAAPHWTRQNGRHKTHNDRWSPRPPGKRPRSAAW